MNTQHRSENILIAATLPVIILGLPAIILGLPVIVLGLPVILLGSKFRELTRLYHVIKAKDLKWKSEQLATHYYSDSTIVI